MAISQSQKLAVLTLSLSICFGVVGQLLLKLAAMHSLSSIGSASTIGTTALAIAIYSLGIICWMVALRHMPLNIAYPVTSLSYIGILWGSWYWFNETLSAVRLLGVLLIFTGVLMVVLKAPAARPESDVVSKANAS
jgi:multidrug transporter EmrE-like cation transporter